jgi:acyl carrier protein phosphodiesterase
MSGANTCRKAPLPSSYLAAAMNFLGHLFLSGDDPMVITGNFMADAVKGRDLSRFDPRLQQGIRLHRRIDTFTDAHRTEHSGRTALRTHAGHYAPVVLDLFFDHLLAHQWERWHTEPLHRFTGRMYEVLQANAAHMPERTQRMLPYMIAGDWLTSYAGLDGLASALHGLSRRAVNGARMAGAERVLIDHRSQFEQEFEPFLQGIIVHVDEA